METTQSKNSNRILKPFINRKKFNAFYRMKMFNLFYRDLKPVIPLFIGIC